MVKLLNKLSVWFAPRLTRTRIVLAVAVAVMADFLQVILLPAEWIFIQQIIDVITMGLTILIIGFHPLLLPTFLVEFIPLVDMMPTWTACVIAVITLRKRGEHAAVEEKQIEKSTTTDPIQ